MTRSAFRSRIGTAGFVLLAHAALLYMAWIVRLQLAVSDESVLTAVFISRPVVVPAPPQLPPVSNTALHLSQPPAVPSLSPLSSLVLPEIAKPVRPGTSISLGIGAQFDCAPRPGAELAAEHQLRCRDLFRGPGDAPTVYVYTPNELALRQQWEAEAAPPIPAVPPPAATAFHPCSWVGGLCWPTPSFIGPFAGVPDFGVSREFDVGNGFALMAGVYTETTNLFVSEHIAAVRIAYRW
jgi:hypothetical protein